MMAWSPGRPPQPGSGPSAAHRGPCAAARRGPRRPPARRRAHRDGRRGRSDELQDRRHEGEGDQQRREQQDRGRLVAGAPRGGHADMTSASSHGRAKMAPPKTSSAGARPAQAQAWEETPRALTPVAVTACQVGVVTSTVGRRRARAGRHTPRRRSPEVRPARAVRSSPARRWAGAQSAVQVFADAGQHLGAFARDRPRGAAARGRAGRRRPAGGGVGAHGCPPWRAVSTASRNGFQVRTNAASEARPSSVRE